MRSEETKTSHMRLSFPNSVSSRSQTEFGNQKPEKLLLTPHALLGQLTGQAANGLVMLAGLLVGAGHQAQNGRHINAGFYL